MRVVIDTNILVSAVIRDRLPERVLLWCLERHDVEWVATPAILEEYGGVIQRPKFKLPQPTISWWLDLIFAGTRLVQPRGSIDFARDRKDVAFLLCSQSCRADYLITGDGDFSDARSLIQTKICSVSVFAEICAPELLAVQ